MSCQPHLGSQQDRPGHPANPGLMLLILLTKKHTVLSTSSSTLTTSTSNSNFRLRGRFPSAWMVSVSVSFKKEQGSGLVSLEVWFPWRSGFVSGLVSLWGLVSFSGVVSFWGLVSVSERERD